MVSWCMYMFKLIKMYTLKFNKAVVIFSFNFAKSKQRYTIVYTF